MNEQTSATSPQDLMPAHRPYNLGFEATVLAELAGLKGTVVAELSHVRSELGQIRKVVEQHDAKIEGVLIEQARREKTCAAAEVVRTDLEEQIEEVEERMDKSEATLSALQGGALMIKGGYRAVVAICLTICGAAALAYHLVSALAAAPAK